jgi:hypothetical protein
MRAWRKPSATVIPSQHLLSPRQRPTLHTAKILNKLSKSQHSKAKLALQEIWMAKTKKDPVVDAFVETWSPKYEAVEA